MCSKHVEAWYIYIYIHIYSVYKYNEMHGQQNVKKYDWSCKTNLYNLLNQKHQLLCAKMGVYWTELRRENLINPLVRQQNYLRLGGIWLFATSLPSTNFSVVFNSYLCARRPEWCLSWFSSFPPDESPNSSQSLPSPTCTWTNSMHTAHPTVPQYKFSVSSTKSVLIIPTKIHSRVQTFG